MTTKNEEKCRFCTPKSPKTPQNGPTNRKHAIFGAQTPIFWTQTSRPSKMKELNKALHRTAHKAPPVTADVRHKWIDMMIYGKLATATPSPIMDLKSDAPHIIAKLNNREHFKK